MRTLDVYATSDIARSSFVFIDAFIAGQAYTFPRDTSNRPDGFLHEGTKRYVMPGLRQRPALVDAPMNGSMRPQYSAPNLGPPGGIVAVLDRLSDEEHRPGDEIQRHGLYGLHRAGVVSRN